MEILKFFPPGMAPRKEQEEVLAEVERLWHLTDVFSIDMPVGAGKSAVAHTIGAWRAAQKETTTITVPSNILLDQYGSSFPDLAILRRQSLYTCINFKRSCAVTKEQLEFCCKGCGYMDARASAKAAKIKALTTMGYVANRMYSTNLIADEAHNLVDLLRDTAAVKIWRKQYKFPTDLQTLSDVIEWVQHALRSKPNKRLERMLEELLRIRLGAIVEYKDAYNRGKPDTLLQVSAVSAVSAAPLLWPKAVRKIILMSATIGHKDVEELRLHKQRVTYLKCDSPIPAANRPIRFAPAANMAYKYRKASVPMLAAKLRELLLAYPTKGLIHVPYEVAAQLQAHLEDSRLIWHSKANKTKQFNAFKASDPAEGKVLVASGMYEGIDLPYDAARWQVIGVVPYPPLGVAWVKNRAIEDPGWYIWETVKKLVQASGRVVRAADDKGDTIVTDLQFARLLSKHRDLFPSYFLEAIV